MIYTIDGFIEKNKNSANKEVSSILSASTNNMVKLFYSQDDSKENEKVDATVST